MRTIGISHDFLYIILHVTRPVSIEIVQMHNSVGTSFKTCISTTSLVILHQEAKDSAFCLECFKKQQNRLGALINPTST